MTPDQAPGISKAQPPGEDQEKFEMFPAGMASQLNAQFGNHPDITAPFVQTDGGLIFVGVRDPKHVDPELKEQVARKAWQFQIHYIEGVI